MKKTLQLVCLLLLAGVGWAQNLTTVTATKIQKAGMLLPSGKIYFQATDANDNAISFQVGGGGQAVTYPYCGVIVSGAISSACTGGTFQVANPGMTAPLNINYRVTVTDGTRTLLTYTGVQFTGGTFNFDNYVPSSNLPLGSSTPFLTIGTGSLSNYIDVTEIVSPGTPPTGKERWYADLSTHQITCIRSDGTNCGSTGTGSAAGGFCTSFIDALVPIGTINGVNQLFQFPCIPSPSGSLIIVRNGLIQAAGIDYNLVGSTIAFMAGSIPQSGDLVLSWFRTATTGGAVFVDIPTISGAVNGVNNIFNVTAPPNPVASALFTQNGLVDIQGTDYSLAGGAFTFGIAPTSGSILQTWYRTANGATNSFSDFETPLGALNGVNLNFTLSHAPVPPNSLLLFRNGVVETLGIDYTISSSTINFLPTSIPQTGDSLRASYRF